MIKYNDRVLGSHFFTFNPSDNGGEGLTLETIFLDNGDGKEGVYLNQTLTLQSYCNSASFGLVGACLTPEKLRELANQLDEFRSKL